jgi:hypothetical protein
LSAMGDTHCSPHYAVLALYRLVGEAPRPVVGDGGSAVLLCLTLVSVDRERQRIGMRRLATTIYRGLTYTPVKLIVATGGVLYKGLVKPLTLRTMKFIVATEDAWRLRY